MKGGYIIINKSDIDLYNKLSVCLELGKPILWYEDETTCYFIDTISGGEITTEIVDDEEVTTYGDIILTKGSLTITITSENVVTEEGTIKPIERQLYQHNLVLGKSNARLSLTIINDNNTPFTETSLKSYLYTNGYTSSANGLMCSGIISTDRIAYNIHSNNSTIRVGEVKSDLSIGSDAIYSAFVTHDTIIEL